MNERVSYRLGDLIVDAGRGRVMRGQEEIALPKLSFDLLLAMVRAAPNLLSIDELMNQVWPGLVVSPETVIHRVKVLRDALGDDPKSPKYIGGLRGRGYQIIVPVEVLQGAHPMGSPVSLAFRRSAAVTSRTRLARCTIALGAAGTWWHFAHRAKPAPGRYREQDDRHSSLPGPEREARSGVFRRRHGRGNPQSPGDDSGSPGDRSYLLGPLPRRQPGCA